MAKKFSVTIRNNCVWHAMQANNLFEEQISNMRSIINFMTWCEVSHFRESVHNHKKMLSRPDVDINTSDTSTPTHQISGPITRARAR
jgi:hypothetical protein